MIVDKITRSVYHYYIKNKAQIKKRRIRKVTRDRGINASKIIITSSVKYLLIPSDIVILFCPKSGDTPYKVPCQYFDFVSELTPGPKYICFISIGLLRTRHMISLIEN